MQKSNQVLRNKFDNLYFHAKFYIEKKKSNQMQYFIEKIGLCRVQTWMKFDMLYKIKMTKYHKIKFDTSLKNYSHAKYKILDWEQF